MSKETWRDFKENIIWIIKIHKGWAIGIKTLSGAQVSWAVAVYVFQRGVLSVLSRPIRRFSEFVEEDAWKVSFMVLSVFLCWILVITSVCLIRRCLLVLFVAFVAVIEAKTLSPAEGAKHGKHVKGGSGKGAASGVSVPSVSSSDSSLGVNSSLSVCYCHHVFFGLVVISCLSV